MSKRGSTKNEAKDTRPELPTRAEVMQPEAVAKPEISRAQKSLQKRNSPANLQKVESHGELMKRASELVASMYGVHDMKLAAQLVDQAMRVRTAWSSGDIGDPLEIAMTMVMEMKPETITETMLGMQMNAVHNAAMASLQKAAYHRESSENPDMHMSRTTRLMRLFVDQIEAMAKLKGKTGQQKVTVEHVHVHEGGQAIVGAVSAAGPRQGEGGSSEKQNKTR